MNDHIFKSIGFVESPYHQRFGIPRQPGLAPNVESTIILNDDAKLVSAMKGLETFSHIWVVFVFHQTGAEKWKPTVRPPRLGGAKKMGVLATRSPHRPNPIGISVVRIKEIKTARKNQVHIIMTGADLLNGTPIIDIKPYLIYCDAPKKTRSGWASEKIKKLTVKWTKPALLELKKFIVKEEFAQIKKSISEILALDPRPAFQKRKKNDDLGKYGISLYNVDIQWELCNSGSGVLVTSVQSLREFSTVKN